jgi:hypothetical protein
VSEYRNDQPLDVIGDHEVAAFDERKRLGSVVERKASAGAHAEVQNICVARGADDANE